jgi:hypothetical protein
VAVSTIELRAHPQSRCDDVEVIADVDVEAGVIVVRYAIVGDHVRIPAAGTTLDPERLWAHTCCELFVAPALGESYVEWNFSPSGQIARFEFSGYRTRIPAGPPVMASSVVTVEGGALRLDARVPLPSDAARMSITAVVEDTSGSLSYWAVRHPCERPDFHHPEGFALELTVGPSIEIVHR